MLIKESPSNKGNIYFCDNANMFYRGGAQHGILSRDGLHSSGNGTRKLGKNPKNALWDLLDLPIGRNNRTTKISLSQ